MTTRKKKPHKEYELGDKVWICGVRANESKTQGTVVYKFRLPENPEELYVIEVETGVDSVYEVRDWGACSNTEDGYLNFWQH